MRHRPWIGHIALYAHLFKLDEVVNYVRIQTNEGGARPAAGTIVTEGKKQTG